MERPKYIFCILMSLLFCNLLTAQHKYQAQIYQAYIDGDMSQWESIISRMEQENSNSTSDKLELISYYYGYTGYLIGISNNKKAKNYISKAESLIDQVLKDSPDNATAYAFKGSFIGFKLSLNKIQAPKLGPNSMKYIKKAYNLEPDNIQAIADKANMLYYAPRMFGGNKTEALGLYRKSIQQIEAKGNIRQNWFYLNLLTLLAQHYSERKEKEKATEIYKKILDIEPSFKWVRDELYPKIKN